MNAEFRAGCIVLSVLKINFTGAQNWPFMMKKAVITGGAGFIGSHLSDILLANAFKVCVIDNFSLGRTDFLQNDNPNLEVAEADILDYAAISDIMIRFQPEIVFHLAALHHIPTCENEPAKAIVINISGSENVFMASKASGVKKVVLASTGAVYSTDFSELLEDSTPATPIDVYSISKFAAENLLEMHVRRNHFQGVSCRIFNTIGPRETNRHLVPDILDQLQDGPVSISLGNLDTKRSYIHVRDTAMGIFRTGTCSHEKAYEVFNLGSPEEYSVLDLVKIIGKIHGHKIEVIQDPARMRKNDRKNQKANISKAKGMTGWKPEHSVEQALAEALAEIKSNAQD
ncbi:MAG: NAD(P)-dependent oxidoreductase [Bacteroidetes bacterium]|nr:MAG: NAD(P)-dependent oxidoreductase [Bacteroidota bacterium]REJ99708.1 MAG: NAD(P)-dependent oxidoreductase [Bacteroidota bacterium]REK32902.1 MAG: NAD(P)-dependent oxidoreductase [Bacteroidota bacterium]REK47707.1 MAG: NAD(P)-dependent oxidoreductase [Bacteroidota bacterium]